MRFYYYSSTAATADLSIRASSGQSILAYKHIGVNLYQLSSVTDDISALTPTAVPVDTSIKFGYNDGLEGVLEWTDFSTKTYIGEIQLQAGWNVVEIYVPDTKLSDFNFKSVVLNYKA